jgi:hypothetical protein
VAMELRASGESRRGRRIADRRTPEIRADYFGRSPARDACPRRVVAANSRSVQQESSWRAGRCQFMKMAR